MSGLIRNTDVEDELLMELGDWVIGDHIGTGRSRDVYVFNPNQELVIKIENQEPESWFQNVKEWDLYDRGTQAKAPWLKWLAPATRISPSGRLLIMARTRPLRPGERLPREVPEFLADLALCNWGWLNGRLVCHDYGVNLLEIKSRLVKAQWDLKRI